MGKLHPTIPQHIFPWLAKQHMFWVATAPTNCTSGHVNVSPKCTEGTFHVVDEKRVWYEDLTGSGVETIAHVRENKRITILFHAFEGPPQIVRIYGQGTIYEYGTPEYTSFLSSVKTTRLPGSRAIIVIDIIQVMTTCGFSVPFYEFIAYRRKLHDWATRLESHDRQPQHEPTPQQQQQQQQGMKQWWHTRNVASLDGLPGLRSACEFDNPNTKIVGPTRMYNGSAATTVNKVQSRMVDVLSGMVLGVALALFFFGFWVERD